MPTAGSVSQFTANGKSPAYSTAAFPTGTAGTSGNVLTSDGTNWISSAPATSGTVTSVSGTANQVSVATGTTTPVISLIGPYTPATYTAHGVLIGEGTSSIVATAVGSTGQVLTGVTGSDPVWASPATSGTVTSVSGTTNQVSVATGTTTPVISLVGPYTPATYTAHGVLIGEGTSSIVATATGTALQVLQSGGASANPAYSTATYPSTAGTSGNVLTSDGTNWNSTAPAAPAFTPNSIVQIFDDFIGVQMVTLLIGSLYGLIGNLTWLSLSATSNFNATTPAVSGHPGIIGNANTVGSAQLYLSDSTTGGIPGSIVLGAGAITLNFVIQLAILSNGTNTYRTDFGLDDGGNGNFIIFRYSSSLNSGNWQILTSKASTVTTTNTSTAADTGWHNFQISINSAGTSVQFFIDGVSQGTIATNVPIVALSPYISCIRTGGTTANNSMLVDLFYMQQTLTTAR